MTPEQINVAIAEACGWKHIQLSERGIWIGVNDQPDVFRPIPDYYHDLNACAEMERLLDYKPVDTRSLYMDNLYCICGWNEAKNLDDARFEGRYKSIRATATQRCEAFLRVLGKWKD